MAQFLRALFGRNATIACCSAPVNGVAMAGEVEETIEALMKRFRVGTDQQLADRLKLGRSTVTSWRRRGKVPERYGRFASERSTTLPDLVDPNLDPVDRQALVLALVRFALQSEGKMANYPGFLKVSGFLPAQLSVGMDKALIDLAARMEESGIDDPYQAMNLIVFEEFFDRK
jgi:Bacteriophage CI repressor helix-turn-helix domain